MSCPFKDIFGKPGEGVHSWRVLDVAVVDTVLTFILAMIIKIYFLKTFSFVQVLVGTFVIGEVMHFLFCVDTKVIRVLRG